MNLTLYTECFFDASHQLDGHPGPCRQLHGHSWKVSVWVAGTDGQLDDCGILWDFGKLHALKDELDHRHLNAVLPANPTAENLALHIYRRLKAKDPDLQFRVRVYESQVPSPAYCETGDPDAP